VAQILKPPAPLPPASAMPSVFLAGSIEMGAAEDWQARLTHALQDLDVLIFNPRRDEWDASWEQSLGNPQFREQVEWELAGLERATAVAMYFAPATKAPVTLLELGLCARSGKVVVCCPEGYWRRGNIEVVCARYDLPLVASLDELTAEVRARLVRREVYTMREVAALCKVAERTVRKWFDSGRLGGFVTLKGRRRCVPREVLIRFLREHGMPLPGELGGGEEGD
jgi:excisionase family DNA binding protein